MLTYEMSFDQQDEMCHTSASSAPDSFFFDFVYQMIPLFGKEYVQNPNENDLCRGLAINATRDFPGCIGSWDCQYWVWENDR